MNGARTARWLACATAVLAAAMALLAVPQVAAAAEVSILPEEPIVGHELKANYDATVDPAQLEWVRCQADQPPCSTVVGTGASYVIAADDLGHSLAVRVAGGEDRSPLTLPVYAIPPELTNVSINGTALVGELLTADVSVTGDPAPVLGYQWYRCSGDPLDCTAIPGAMSDTYVVTSADDHHRLSLTVTATNLVDTAVRSALSAQQAPAVTSVTIAGTAIVGQRLTASATATGIPAPTITYQWLRCGPLLPTSCNPIDGETGTSYEVSPGDAGFRLAVRARAENSAGVDANRSSPSEVVPDPPDSGSNFDQTGTPPALAPSTPTGSAVLPTNAALRYLRPFPVVRIKGLLVAGGAQVTLLRVTAPRGSKVRVRCKRTGCPLRRRTRRAGRIRAFERFLPAGVRITIRVVKPGFIGKHVRIKIRDGRAPARRDSCVLPGRKRATTCPQP